MYAPKNPLDAWRIVTLFSSLREFLPWDAA